MLALGGVFLLRGTAATKAALPPVLLAAAEITEDAPLSDEAPSAPAKSREQKRSDRYDKDRDEAITRDEYLASRRKAFAKLDVNGDGRLGFEEWAVRTTTKFVGADKGKSGRLTRAEFLTTAPRRRKVAATPTCACPAPAAPESED